MTQISLSGYGTMAHVDDTGLQHGFGTFNKITSTGLERIIKADTSLKTRSYPFHYIIATKNLPRDKEVFTRTELTQYSAHYMAILPSETKIDVSSDKKQCAITFGTDVGVNPLDVAIEVDTLSLVYTDGLDNFYICTYANYINPVTDTVEPYTVGPRSKTSSSYRLQFSIAKNLTGAEIEFTDVKPMMWKTEFSGEYVSANNPQYNEHSRATRLPYVDGSHKLKFLIAKNVSSGWSNFLVSSLFILDYKVDGRPAQNDGSGLRHVVEIELIQPSDAPEKLGTVIAAPEGLKETLRVMDYDNGNGKRIEFIADPLAEVKFFLAQTLISRCITDSNGFGTAIFASAYSDPITGEYRQTADGLLMTVKTTNSIGTFEQEYIPIDNLANRITHWNWIDDTHLKVVGRLNDTVKIYVASGYTSTGAWISNVEVGSVTLVTPDTRYGYDGASAIMELDILAQYPLYYTAKVKAHLIDASGNEESWYDVEITSNSLGLPNMAEFARPNPYSYYGLEEADAVSRISLITKGSKA